MGQWFRYTPEQIDFLKNNIEGTLIKDLTTKFNKHFGLNKTYEQIKRICYRLKLTKGLKHVYTEEQSAFIRENLEGRTNKELTELFNQHFNLNLRKNQIAGYKSTHNLCPGMHRNRYRPVGSERVGKDDYIIIKIADPNKWRPKHIHIWEQENGPVPKNHVVLFGDGDKRNFDIDNLILVHRKLITTLNSNQLISNNAELTKTGIVIAEISQKISERKRNAEKTK
ncbi:HNH endonuclease [Mesobacillus persicus]|uniref:HNH endonuclease n=1 Tax=Mesobacillus persicus TaxID=930146 RepID=A0A1H7XP11_9BACI|nr:HNH endonuclease signature motif containing protein [Mesobacillus persicus]SEM35556.1 HNH endonuclease [Mesobacillus persicus]